MRRQYHVLNGDMLKLQFPAGIEGDIIVFRECLVDGNVKASSLEEFYSSRAAFLSKNYGVADDYFEKVVPGIQKILKIESGSDVNLWFEDDLFCQVNFWFVVHLLVSVKSDSKLFLIRPQKHDRFGFGGLKADELIALFKKRLFLNEPSEIARLWELYQKDEREELLRVAQELSEIYPFILPAVQAHIERIPTEENPGRPVRALTEIMYKMQTTDFKIVFNEFCRRESIYGFGDLQVKKLFDAILNDRKRI